MRQRYTVIVERAPTNYSAYVPDVPGCIATGDSIEETLTILTEALTDHLAVLHEHGQRPPEPTTALRDVTPHSLADLVTTIAVDLPAGAPQPARMLA